MSQENMEIVRALSEGDFMARTSGEFDPEAAISRMAEFWDPEIELDASETPALDISGIYRERMPLGSGGESGTPHGKPSDSSTSWLTPGTA
jgi:hypothetical protein